MPAPLGVTPDLLEAVELYESSDLGAGVAAEQFGVTRDRLVPVLKKRGTYRTQTVANNLARERGEVTRIVNSGLPTGDICAAYEAGMSENELARTHGTTRNTIGKILRYGGVQRRTMTEANRLMAAGRTPEENARNSEAAHAAVRGVKHTWEQRCSIAKGNHGRVTCWATELVYEAWLRLRDIQCVTQHAIGPYNCDLAAEPVAVEIFGGQWHGSGKHAASFAERGHYILDQGWALVIVWVDQQSQRLGEASADYVASFIKEARSDPALRGQYRVIWGDGEVVPTAGRQLDDFASVPPRRSRQDSRRRNRGARQ